MTFLKVALFLTTKRKTGWVVTMDIRKGMVADAEAISSILAQSWKVAFKGSVPQVYLDELKEDFWVDFFQQGIRDERITVQLVYEAQVPVGCISYGKSRDSQVADWAEIITLYLLPQSFGKKYGKALLDVDLAEMKGQGYENAYLWALDENERARNFYEGQGFSWNGDQNVVEIMGKSLVNLRYVRKI